MPPSGSGATSRPAVAEAGVPASSTPGTVATPGFVVTEQVPGPLTVVQVIVGTLVAVKAPVKVTSLRRRSLCARVEAGAALGLQRGVDVVPRLVAEVGPLDRRGDVAIGAGEGEGVALRPFGVVHFYRVAVGEGDPLRLVGARARRPDRRQEADAAAVGVEGVVALDLAAVLVVGGVDDAAGVDRELAGLVCAELRRGAEGGGVLPVEVVGVDALVAGVGEIELVEARTGRGDGDAVRAGGRRWRRSARRRSRRCPLCSGRRRDRSRIRRRRCRRRRRSRRSG